MTLEEGRTKLDLLGIETRDTAIGWFAHRRESGKTLPTNHASLIWWGKSEMEIIKHVLERVRQRDKGVM